jgi:hypothetical protein
MLLGKQRAQAATTSSPGVVSKPKIWFGRRFYDLLAVLSQKTDFLKHCFIYIFLS